MIEMQESQEEAKPEVDLVDKAVKGEVDLDSLSDADLDKIISGEYSEKKTIVPEFREKKEAQPKVEEQSDANYGKTESSDSLDALAILHERQRMQEEHEYKLRHDNTYREAYLRNLGISDNNSTKKVVDNSYSSESTNDVDVYSEEWLLKIREVDKLKNELNEIKSTIAQSKEEQLATARRLQVEQELKMDMLGIKELQADFPELKTSKPFEQIDQEYSAFYNTLGPENVNRFFTDQAYRASVESRGLRLPSEFEQYQKLNMIYKEYKDSNGNKRYPSLKKALKASDIYDGLIEQRLSSSKQNSVAQVDARDLIAQRLKDNASKPTVLSDSNTKSVMATDTMTASEMARFLENYDHRFASKAQQQTYDLIMNKLGM